MGIWIFRQYTSFLKCVIVLCKSTMSVSLITKDGLTLATVRVPSAADMVDFDDLLVSARIDPTACIVIRPLTGSKIEHRPSASPMIQNESLAAGRDIHSQPPALTVAFDETCLLDFASLLRFGSYPLHLAIRLRAPASALLSVLAAAPEVAKIPDPRFGLPLHAVLRFPPFPEMVAVVCALIIAAPSSLAAAVDSREGATTALHLACANGAPLDVIELLLRPPDAVAALPASEPHLASTAMAEGRLPLHEAARAAASPAVIKALIAACPAAASAVDLRGNTPLHWLLQCSRQSWPVPTESIHALLAAAPAAAAARNCLGLLPLHLAAACDAAGIAALLEANPFAACDGGARGSPSRRFPLQRVLAAAASLRMLRLDMDADADADAEPEVAGADFAWRGPALLALLQVSPREALGCAGAAQQQELPLLHAAAATPGVPLRLVRALIDACPTSARRWWRSPTEALELPVGAACLASPCRGDLVELLLEAGEAADTAEEAGSAREEHVCGDPLAGDASADAADNCLAATAGEDSLRSYSVPHAQLVRRIVRVAKLPFDLPERDAALEAASASLAALVASARRRAALDSVPWPLLLNGRDRWPVESLMAAFRERAARQRLLVVAARHRLRTAQQVKLAV